MADEQTAMLLNQPFVFDDFCRLVGIYIVPMENLLWLQRTQTTPKEFMTHATASCVWTH